MERSARNRRADIPDGHDWLFLQSQRFKSRTPLDGEDVGMFFPMYLMSWSVVMLLEGMEMHQRLRARGQLTELTESMVGKVIFISHEWLGLFHPDPKGVQWRVLQRIVERVDTGRVTVGTEVSDRMMGFTRKPAGGAHWQALFPRCFFWLDYAGVPQLCENGNIQDVRLSQLMMLAVNSIPAYVDMSSLVLILTPHAQHDHVVGRVCNFASWSRRGWCRVERLCAFLARSRVPMVAVMGPEAPLRFEPTSSTHIMPGRGSFTCCQLGHVIDGREIPCDKTHLHRVVQSLLATAAEHKRRSGKRDVFRLIRCYSPFWLRGFPGRLDEVHAWTHDLTSFREALGWCETEESVQVRRRCGSTEKRRWTLLHWAALTGNAALVREVLHQGGDACLNDLCPTIGMFLVRNMSPLFLATISAAGTFDAAEVLLDARADPDRCNHSHLGSSWIRASQWPITEEQMQGLLENCPEGVDKRDGVYGSSALVALLGFCEESDNWNALVSHGADMRADTYVFGPDSVLQLACRNRVPNVAAVQALIEARCSVNAAAHPTTRGWTALMYGLRASVRLSELRGRRPDDEFTLMFASEGYTPLHWAAQGGHAELVHLLLEARARCRCNARDEAPLESAKRAFGGQPPEALVRLLAADRPTSMGDTTTFGCPALGAFAKA